MCFVTEQYEKNVSPPHRWIFYYLCIADLWWWTKTTAVKSQKYCHYIAVSCWCFWRYFHFTLKCGRGHLCAPTFICVDSLQVHDVTDNVVLICNAISSQHVSGLSGNIQSFAAAIPLQHGNHLWCRSNRMRAIRSEESVCRKEKED